MNKLSAAINHAELLAHCSHFHRGNFSLPVRVLGEGVRQSAGASRAERHGTRLLACFATASKTRQNFDTAHCCGRSRPMAHPLLWQNPTKHQMIGEMMAVGEGGPGPPFRDAHTQHLSRAGWVSLSLLAAMNRAVRFLSARGVSANRIARSHHGLDGPRVRRSPTIIF